MDTPALRLHGLSKRFGAKTAVEDLSLDVPRGSFYGFVGPNGAGKTTALSMATGLLRPDRGAVSVLEEAAGRPVADYSAGMTKKIALASAMVHAPELLVLDEPFEAVDPVSARTIRSLLDSYVASGGTVIVSSHVMDLVPQL